MELHKNDAAQLCTQFSALHIAEKTSVVPDIKQTSIKYDEVSVPPDPFDKQHTQTSQSKQRTRPSRKKKQASHASLLSWLEFYQGIFNFWFQQLILRHPVYEPPFNPKTASFVDMICVPFYERNTSHDDVENRFGRRGEQLWFHGTPSFQSAYSILNEGIKVGVSSRRNDFSVGEGFYVSDDFDAACCRAKRNENGGYAVLVFRLREQSLSNCFLDLNKKHILWRKVVRFNRSGYKKEADLKEGISQGYMGRKNSATLKNLHFNELDFIKGAICYDVPKILDDNCPEAPILMTNSSGRVIQQLCIRTHSYAKVFGSLANICAVIWFFTGP